MKKLRNEYEVTLKGELVGADNGLVEALKKDVQDLVDLSEMANDIQEFCKNNIGKEVDMKLSLKIVE